MIMKRNVNDVASIRTVWVSKDVNCDDLFNLALNISLKINPTPPPLEGRGVCRMVYLSGTKLLNTTVLVSSLALSQVSVRATQTNSNVMFNLMYYQNSDISTIV